jgi:DnaJ-class molecular chaperone
LHVQRNSPIIQIKKAYRSLSLELHPDKNKSPTATDDFRILNQAFDVLTDREKRREYDRLGDMGVKALTHAVIDHKYLLLNISIYYFSSAIFGFLLNLGDRAGAYSCSLFCLAGKIYNILISPLNIMNII